MGDEKALKLSSVSAAAQRACNYYDPEWRVRLEALLEKATIAQLAEAQLLFDEVTEAKRCEADAATVQQ